jgi:hypothetical protein
MVKRVPKSKQKVKKIDFQIYVKFPPLEPIRTDKLKNLPSPFVTEHDVSIPSDTRHLLFARRRGFAKDKNPIHAIEAFLIATEARLFPPYWVLMWIRDAFQKYHDGQGRLSMDKVMQLSGLRGKRTAFSLIFNSMRDDLIFHDVWLLNFLFRISIENAAEMVVRRFEATPNWNTTGFKIAIPTPKYIREQYQARGKRMFDSAETRHVYGQWTANEAGRFLALFPKDSYEDYERKIKKIISDMD